MEVPSWENPLEMMDVSASHAGWPEGEHLWPWEHENPYLVQGFTS